MRFHFLCEDTQTSFNTVSKACTHCLLRGFIRQVTVEIYVGVVRSGPLLAKWVPKQDCVVVPLLPNIMEVKIGSTIGVKIEL